MKFANKELKDYWKIIKIPTYILVAWALLGTILSIVSFSTYLTIFSPLASWILTIAVFGFAGWTAVKDHKERIKVAAWSGALIGVIVGLAGAVLSIILYFLFPSVIQATLQMAGTNAAAAQDFLLIGLLIGFVTGPLINGIVGAIISVIAGLIASKL